MRVKQIFVQLENRNWTIIWDKKNGKEDYPFGTEGVYIFIFEVDNFCIKLGALKSIYCTPISDSSC